MFFYLIKTQKEALLIQSLGPTLSFYIFAPTLHTSSAKGMFEVILNTSSPLNKLHWRVYTHTVWYVLLTTSVGHSSWTGLLIKNVCVDNVYCVCKPTVMSLIGLWNTILKLWVWRYGRHHLRAGSDHIWMKGWSKGRISWLDLKLF